MHPNQLKINNVYSIVYPDLENGNKFRKGLFDVFSREKDRFEISHDFVQIKSNFSTQFLCTKIIVRILTVQNFSFLMDMELQFISKANTPLYIHNLSLYE